MDHWIEPQALAGAQGAGPLVLVAPPAPEPAPPSQGPPVGRLSGIFDVAKKSLPALLVGVAIGACLGPWIKKKLKV